LSGIKVVRSTNVETTALGVAYLAGLAVGFWTLDKLQKKYLVDRVFTPSMNQQEVSGFKLRWVKAVERAKRWIE
jgi:glycerol kinase